MNLSPVWEDIGPFRALVDPGQRSPELMIALADLPARLNQGLVEVLRVAPCQTIRLHLMAGSFERDLVVQLFPEERHPGRGTQALSLGARSYLTAQSLTNLGIGVPTPLACLERRAGPRVLGSYFITEYVEGGVSFDHELGRLFKEEPNLAATTALITQVALALRNMHDLGVFHRALNNRGILLGPTLAGRPRRVMFLDLFRTRLKSSPNLREQAYDLTGMSLPPHLRRILFDAYWNKTPPAAFETWAGIWRKTNRWTAHRPFRAWLNHLSRPPSRLPTASEQWLWDPSTQTAVDMAQDPCKIYKRTTSQLSIIAHLVAQQIYAHAFRESISLDHLLSVGLRAQPETLIMEMALLGNLGIRDVMIRFYHHDSPESRRFALTTVQKMTQSGFYVSGVLVQDRRAVRDPALWTHFVNQVLGCVGWQLQRVEFGHALNLPAWGVRSADDYRRLIEPLPELQNAYPGVAFAGPGIDGLNYRFARQAAKALPAGCRWDAFALRIADFPAWSELSDDRLLRRCAGWLAEIRPQGNSTSRLIVSEMHRPAIVTGKDSYLEAARWFRRILMLTCAGLVDQTVLWWLTDIKDAAANDPALRALARLRKVLAGGRFVKRLSVGDSRSVFLLHCENVITQPVLIGWVDGPPLQLEVPFQVSSAMDMHGRTAPLLPYPRLRLTSTPVYFYGG